jgi:NADPH-dependent stearoyl-CoA 9-desaturase
MTDMLPAPTTAPARRPGDLSSGRLEEFGAEMDALRAEVLDRLGAEDAAYVRRVIALQRRLELTGRLTLLAGSLPPAWVAGTALLATAKILENMEIAHNVLHGQWDWMRDPTIHSSTWEWDNACPSSQWRHSHNEVHHVWTNVEGRDRDLGYGVVRLTTEEEWRPSTLPQPIYAALLALFFQWGVAVHDVEVHRLFGPDPEAAEAARARLAEAARKAARQVLKDYVAFPLLAGPSFLPVLTGNLAANAVRNVWAFTVIFCGHFPAGVERFTVEEVEGETRGAWYARQVLGSANISGGRLMHLLTGNLDHQIEHHLFPDLPSNRYAELAPRVRDACERAGLPYRTGSLAKQFGSVVAKIVRHALPG